MLSILTCVYSEGEIAGYDVGVGNSPLLLTRMYGPGS